jgi:hypothetical protein
MPPLILPTWSLEVYQRTVEEGKQRVYQLLDDVVNAGVSYRVKVVDITRDSKEALRSVDIICQDMWSQAYREPPSPLLSNVMSNGSH